MTVRAERVGPGRGGAPAPSVPSVAAPPEIPHRRELAEVLAARQRALGAGPLAEANARALAEPGCGVVVAGQQPGLFGGTLLSFHKAAATVALARRLAERGGRRVVPLFWSASDDHDLDEVRGVSVLDRSGEPHRVVFRGDGGGRSLHDVPVAEDTARALLGELAALLPDTARAREALALLAPPPSPTFSAWSIRCLLRMLGDTGLVVVEPPALARWTGPFHSELLRRSRDVEAAVRRGGERLRAAGKPAPLEPVGPPVFVRDEPGGPRRRALVDERGNPAHSLLERIERDPTIGSGDVVGRVLAQDRLLPVVAFVVGPSERMYVEQTREAHEALAIPFPPIWPRPQACWVDARAEETAAAFGGTVAELLAGPDVPESPPAAAGETGADVVDADLVEASRRLASLRPALEGLLDRGGEAADAVRRGLERIDAEWRRTEERAREALARRRGAGSARWQRLVQVLRPSKKPQERVLSPVSITARHGVEALREGLAALDPTTVDFLLFHLDEEAA